MKKSEFKEIIREELKNVLKEEIWLPAKSVPTDIQKWVNDTVGRVQKYSLIQGDTVHVSMPWHEADRNYYQLFQLLPGNRAKFISKIGSIHFPVVRSGMEGTGAITGKELGGKFKVPSGFVVVRAGIYPKGAKIYTSDDASKFLPSSGTKSADLTDVQLAILWWAKALKSFARPKIKDQGQYDDLVKKGLLKKNKSITIDGRNIVQQADAIRRLQKMQDTEKYPNLHNIY